MAQKRRVIIGHQDGKIETMTLGPIPRPSRLRGHVSTPTGDSRHITRIREGRISPEAYSKEKRAQIPVDWDISVPVKKEADNASQEPQTTAVGVRSEGSGVGEEAPLQPATPKEGAKARKKVKRKKGDN